MSRTVKKLTLKYQFLRLELDEIQDEMDQLTSDWSNRFGKYLVPEEKEMWRNEETGELREELPVESKPKKQKNKRLKKYYREASTKLHPDKGGSDDSFSKLKEAYENDDLLELISVASDNNYTIELDEEDLESIQESVESIAKKITDKKSTMIWLYYKGDQNAKRIVIDRLEQIAGKKIDPEDLVD